MRLFFVFEVGGHALGHEVGGDVHVGGFGPAVEVDYCALTQQRRKLPTPAPQRIPLRRTDHHSAPVFSQFWLKKFIAIFDVVVEELGKLGAEFVVDRGDIVVLGEEEVDEAEGGRVGELVVCQQEHGLVLIDYRTD